MTAINTQNQPEQPASLADKIIAGGLGLYLSALIWDGVNAPKYGGLSLILIGISLAISRETSASRKAATWYLPAFAIALLMIVWQYVSTHHVSGLMFLLLAIGLTVTRMMLRNKQRQAFISGFPLLLVFCSVAISSALAALPIYSWTSYMKYQNLGLSLCAAFIAAHWLKSPRELKLAMVIVAIAFAFFTAVYLYFLATVPECFTEAKCPNQPIIYYRYYGMTLLLALPYFVAAFNLSAKILTRGLLAAFIIFLLALLLTTGWRSGILGIAFLALALYWLTQSARYAITLVVLLLTLFAVGLLLPGDNQIQQMLGRGASDSARFKTAYLPTLSMLSTHLWFGHGEGVFQQTYDKLFPGLWYTPHEHNLLLHYLFAGGLFGLAANLILIIALLLANYRVYQHSSNDYLRKIALGNLCAWAAFFGEGLTDIVYSNPLGVLIILSFVVPALNRSLNNAAGKPILLLIRDKMGDSLVAANAALAFARAYPKYAVTVMMRHVYAHALIGEQSIQLARFRSGLHAFLIAWTWRLTGKHFATIAILRGFGNRTRSLMHALAPAKSVRVLSGDASMKGCATELVLASDAKQGLQNSVVRILQAIEPRFIPPTALCFGQIAQRWRHSEKNYIVIFPFTDEPRKNLPMPLLEALYEQIREQHSDHQVIVLARSPRDLIGFAPSRRITIRFFSSTLKLQNILLQTAHFIGADTGPLHLAAAIGIPCTVVFGPTQPQVVLLPEQHNVTALRAQALGDAHCDVLACQTPMCMIQAAMEYRLMPYNALDESRLPQCCPMRGALADIEFHPQPLIFCASA